MATNEEKSALSPIESIVSHVDRNDGNNFVNCTLNCFRTHPILQIWPPVTTCCFQISKECSKEKKFGSIEDVISVTEAYFEAKDKSFYKKALN